MYVNGVFFDPVVAVGAGEARVYDLHVPEGHVFAGNGILQHNSQGMTLSKVSVDLRNCFAPGQAYVALSRARSLGGLNIESWRGPGSIICHPTVGAFTRGEYVPPRAPGERNLDMAL